MFSFNCTILTDDSATELCDLLSLPRTEGNVQTVKRGYDIFLKDRVHFDHYSPPDERVYAVRSQGIWHETRKNTYQTSVNGDFRHCTCPQHRNLVRIWTERYPDLPFVPSDAVSCKHGVAVMVKEIYDRERASDETDKPLIDKMEAMEADRFACDGAEVF